MSDAAWKEERPVPTVVMPLEEWESRRRNHEAVVAECKAIQTERDRLRDTVRELVEALEGSDLYYGPLGFCFGCEDSDARHDRDCAKVRAALDRAREVLGT